MAAIFPPQQEGLEWAGEVPQGLGKVQVCLFNQGLSADANPSPQVLQHQMGQESSCMIQALIHNSDLLSQSGHADWRLGQSREVSRQS